MSVITGDLPTLQGKARHLLAPDPALGSAIVDYLNSLGVVVGPSELRHLDVSSSLAATLVLLDLVCPNAGCGLHHQLRPEADHAAGVRQFTATIDQDQVIHFGEGATASGALLDAILAAVASRKDSIAARPEPTEQVLWAEDAEALWSHALRSETRSALVDALEGLVPDVQIALKNADGRFATLGARDFITNRIKLVDRSTGNPIEFVSVDELVHAGWVLD